jgi:hypothetical protein
LGFACLKKDQRRRRENLGGSGGLSAGVLLSVAIAEWAGLMDLAILTAVPVAPSISAIVHL